MEAIPPIQFVLLYLTTLCYWKYYDISVCGCIRNETLA